MRTGHGQICLLLCIFLIHSSTSRAKPLYKVEHEDILQKARNLVDYHSEVSKRAWLLIDPNDPRLKEMGIYVLSKSEEEKKKNQLAADFMFLGRLGLFQTNKFLV